MNDDPDRATRPPPDHWLGLIDRVYVVTGAGSGCDVSEAAAVAAAVQAVLDRWGRIDILVNNAGIGEQAAPTLSADGGWLALRAPESALTAPD